MLHPPNPDAASPDLVPRADLTVADVMSHAVVTVGRNDTLRVADRRMEERGIRHLVVLGSDGEVSGVLSRRDLFRGALARALGYGTVAQDKLFESLFVKEAMSEPAITAAPDLPLRDAARLLVEHRIGCLPILEGPTLVGILTESDFVRRAMR